MEITLDGKTIEIKRLTLKDWMEIEEEEPQIVESFFQGKISFKIMRTIFRKMIAKSDPSLVEAIDKLELDSPEFQKLSEFAWRMEKRPFLSK